MKEKGGGGKLKPVAAVLGGGGTPPPHVWRGQSKSGACSALYGVPWSNNSETLTLLLVAFCF